MTDERIDLRVHIDRICGLLGLEPNDVAQLTITPKNATAVVYQRNAYGQKYLDEDSGPAREIREFAVVA